VVQFLKLHHYPNFAVQRVRIRACLSGMPVDPRYRPASAAASVLRPGAKAVSSGALCAIADAMR
jgi:hypothetical protein